MLTLDGAFVRYPPPVPAPGTRPAPPAGRATFHGGDRLPCLRPRRRIAHRWRTRWLRALALGATVGLGSLAPSRHRLAGAAVSATLRALPLPRMSYDGAGTYAAMRRPCAHPAWPSRPTFHRSLLSVRVGVAWGQITETKHSELGGPFPLSRSEHRHVRISPAPPHHTDRSPSGGGGSWHGHVLFCFALYADNVPAPSVLRCRPNTRPLIPRPASAARVFVLELLAQPL